MPTSLESNADEMLARRIASGDPEAEDEMVRRFQAGLTAMAVVRAGRCAAADLVQETLLEAIPTLRRATWRGESTLQAYLAGILRHRIAKRVQREGRQGVAIDPDGIPSDRAGPEEAAAEDQQRRHVREALRRLPVARRDVLLRHYFDGQTAAEIARDLGIPRGTVLSRLYQARILLAGHLRGVASGRP